MKRLITISFALLLCFGNMQAEDDSWLLNGLVQMRSELDGRDFSNATYPRSFASIKTRIGVQKNIGDDILFFTQIQDSRVFGEEKNTMTSLDNLDFHQAFVKLTNPLGLPMKLQVGRFEVSYGTERFLGAVGWNYTGRAFDGARVSLNPGFNLDVFALTLQEAKRKDKNGNDLNPYVGNATAKTYGPYPDSVDSFSMYGFWSSNQLNDNHKLDVFGYYEFNRNKPVADSVALSDFKVKRVTIGLSHYGTYGNLKSIIEAAYQTGSTANSTGAKDLSAYLISAQAGYQIGDANVGAGFDLISGTKPGSAEDNSFATSYGTNHKFYGFMDYFINVPVNSGGTGLNDIYAKFNYKKKGSKFNFNLAIHQFMANQENANGDSNFGQEFDLTIKYSFIKGTAITWGNSVFLPDELMKNKFSTANVVNQDMSFWSYLMITANIN